MHRDGRSGSSLRGDEQRGARRFALERIDPARAGDLCGGARAAAADPHPLPLQLQQIRAARDDGGGGDARELCQVLHRPVLHQYLLDDAARGAGLHGRLPRAGVPFGLRAGPQREPLQERPGDAGGAAAVRRQRRAGGRLDDAVRLQGGAQRRAHEPRRDRWPLQIMFTERAVIIGIIAVNLPYMVLTLQSVLEGIARNLEEAAFSLGAGPWTMFRRVLWPLAL